MTTVKNIKFEKGIYGMRIDRRVSRLHFTKEGTDISIIENIPNISFAPCITMAGNIKIRANFNQDTILFIPNEEYDVELAKIEFYKVVKYLGLHEELADDLFIKYDVSQSELFNTGRLH